MKKITKQDYLPDLREIEKLVDDYKDEYSDKKLREFGKKDAEAGIPAVDAQALSPFEQQMVHSFWIKAFIM